MCSLRARSIPSWDGVDALDGAPRGGLGSEEYLRREGGGAQQPADGVRGKAVGEEQPVDGAVEGEFCRRSREHEQDHVRVAPDLPPDRALVDEVCHAFGRPPRDSAVSNDYSAPGRSGPLRQQHQERRQQQDIEQVGGQQPNGGQQNERRGGLEAGQGQ